jgi:hypothetical protein
MRDDATHIAVWRHQHDGLFTKNKRGGWAKKMCSDDAAHDGNRPRALDDGNSVAAARGHYLYSVIATAFTPRAELNAAGRGYAT